MLKSSDVTLFKIADSTICYKETPIFHASLLTATFKNLAWFNMDHFNKEIQIILLEVP